MHLFLLISFLAGVLTVLAPCVLPLLPVIIGGSVAGGSSKRAYTVIVSLILSLVLFTLLVKVSSIFLNVPAQVWEYVSASIVFLLGVSMAFPSLWEKIPFVQKASIYSNKVLGGGMMKETFVGDIIMGAALGPVFSTCSPTYFIILATVLPANFLLGLLYLFVYAVGLGLSLLVISLFGQKFANTLAVTFDNHGRFKRSVGALFILVAISISTGFDKRAETAITSAGFFDVTKVEQKLLEATNKYLTAENTETSTSSNKNKVISNTQSSNIVNDLKKLVADVTVKQETTSTTNLPILGRYHEIADPAGFVNTNNQPFTIGQYIGKKIILIDFLTYSCINCQRTFPYLVDWNTKYSDKGLIIIGIHTPEFAFEKVQVNVETAMKKEGITFPIVLDNSYGTWNAYKNNYWPRKYIIDLKGNIVYDHIGEGEYTETEETIQNLLKTIPGNNSVSDVKLKAYDGTLAPSGGISSETYLGYGRMTNNINTSTLNCHDQSCTLTAPATLDKNMFAFSGDWNIQEGKALGSVGSSVIYHTKAKRVHLVAGAQNPGETVTIEVSLDGVTMQQIIIGMSDIYTLYDGTTVKDQVVTFKIIKGNLAAYTFTFS
jgi:cytochrome c biogenesis protein CcdA/thiol-disulfide isomerase/thioredoxin